MSSVPGRRYFSGISDRTGFKIDMLEKVYRIMTILGRLQEDRNLSDRLSLKGGTAIQGLMFGFRRLSIDIDLNYVGSVRKDEMQKDRLEARKALGYILKDLGYTVEQPPVAYAEEQFFLHYNNVGGGRDRLKLEINYLERLPVLGTEVKKLVHPFDDLGDVQARSYKPEELFAGKARALIVRSTPRDLYDAYLFATSKSPFDWDLWRKVSIFYLVMQSVDVRELNTAAIDDLSEVEARNQLLPLVSNRERLDLGAMKEMVRPIADRLLKFSRSEEEYLDKFYSDLVSSPNVLFGGMPVSAGLEDHPSIEWRLHQLREKGG